MAEKDIFTHDNSPRAARARRRRKHRRRKWATLLTLFLFLLVVWGLFNTSKQQEVPSPKAQNISNVNAPSTTKPSNANNQPSQNQNQAPANNNQTTMPSNAQPVTYYRAYYVPGGNPHYEFFPLTESTSPDLSLPAGSQPSVFIKQLPWFIVSSDDPLLKLPSSIIH